MPRLISSAMITALSATRVQPAIFVEAEFLSGPVYLWSGLGSIVWNGHTWIGVGNLASVSPIEEGANVEARGIQLGLSGIHPDMLSAVLDEFRPGLPVSVYLVVFNAGVIVEDPVTAWRGLMDRPVISASGQEASINITCENRLIEMNVPVGRRWTNDEQQRAHPGDLGFSFVNAIQEVPFYWGKRPSTGDRI